jgi:hypothetical protein
VSNSEATSLSIFEKKAQKKTIAQEGERNDGPPLATDATSEGGVQQIITNVEHFMYFGE